MPKETSLWRRPLTEEYDKILAALKSKKAANPQESIINEYLRWVSKEFHDILFMIVRENFAAKHIPKALKEAQLVSNPADIQARLSLSAG
jgi:hypothetical protein